LKKKKNQKKRGKEFTWPQPTEPKPNASPTQPSDTASLRRRLPLDDKLLGGDLRGTRFPPAI
jgi:hypothetical protein